jgi:hypothetical protein
MTPGQNSPIQAEKGEGSECAGIISPAYITERRTVNLLLFSMLLGIGVSFHLFIKMLIALYTVYLFITCFSPPSITV